MKYFKKHASIFMIGVMVILSSCASYSDKDNVVAQLDMATVELSSYIKLSQNGWPAQNWWLAYNDMQLNNLVLQGISNSPTIMQAQTRIRKALAVVKDSKSAYWPTLELSAGLNEQYLSKNGLMSPLGGKWYDETTFGLNLGYSLDLWGKNRKRSAAAVGEANALMAERSQVEQVLASGIVESYYNLQTGLARKELLNEVRAIRLKQLGSYRSLLESGIGVSAEVYKAEVNLHETEKQLSEMQASIDSEREILRELIAGGSEELKDLKRMSVPNVEGKVPNSLGYGLLNRRPDLQAYLWRIKSSRSSIEAAKAAFYPDISINLGAEIDTTDISKFFSKNSMQYSIFPQITLPIFYGGALRAKLEGTRADSDLAVATYNQAVFSAVNEVAQQAIMMSSLEKQYTKQISIRDLNQKIYDNEKAKFDWGLVNMIDLHDNRLAVLSQDDIVLQLKNRKISTNVSLIKALGGGYNQEG